MSTNFKSFVDSFLHVPCCALGAANIDDQRAGRTENQKENAVHLDLKEN
jgi:hypothetical protein